MRFQRNLNNTGVKKEFKLMINGTPFEFAPDILNIILSFTDVKFSKSLYPEKPNLLDITDVCDSGGKFNLKNPTVWFMNGLLKFSENHWQINILGGEKIDLFKNGNDAVFFYPKTTVSETRNDLKILTINNFFKKGFKLNVSELKNKKISLDMSMQTIKSGSSNKTPRYDKDIEEMLIDSSFINGILKESITDGKIKKDVLLNNNILRFIIDGLDGFEGTDFYNLSNPDFLEILSYENKRKKSAIGTLIKTKDKIILYRKLGNDILPTRAYLSANSWVNKHFQKGLMKFKEEYEWLKDGVKLELELVYALHTYEFGSNESYSEIESILKRYEGVQPKDLSLRAKFMVEICEDYKNKRV